MSLLTDINSRLPSLTIECIFDVGANVGQSAVRFRRDFPEAAIHSFEPVSATFAELQRTCLAINVSCHQIALGRDRSEALVSAKGTSSGNRIVTDTKGRTESVAVHRGEDFCAEHQITRIGYLKVDTEGRDLDVLIGFAGMLRDQLIDLVQVEVGMNETNSLHVPFERVVGFMRPLGYDLFSLYGPAFERDGRPLMRRCNPVFIAKRLVAPGLALPRAKPS